MKRTYVATLLGLGLCACGSDGAPRDGESESGSGIGSATDTAGETNSDSASESGSASDSASGGSDTASGSDSDSGGSAVPKFDLPNPDGVAGCGAGGDGGGGGGSADFSYIWIANSQQSTISKINTQTLVEEGRYYTRPDLAGNPSRTSVNLNGNMAVANRYGGVTKFIANTDECVESNGTPGIQTSTGPDDILPWDLEECKSWHTPLVYTSNRPLAWAPGVWNPNTCQYENNKLWTAGANGSGTAEVLLLDGDTGAVDQTIQIPEVLSSIGIYGGAVDGDGNFWGNETGGRLVRVDRNSFAYEVIDAPSNYGIAVDSQGRPWLCTSGVHRYDPTTGTWASSTNVQSSIGGCMTDGNGILWVAHNPMLGIDTETLDVVHTWPIPQDVHGVSIDFDGYIWGVPISGSEAYRVDPGNGNYDTVTGLIYAYTYSDMTGFGLSQAGTPSG